ncbi:hypothetical protein PLICRDRAFT_56048 [Plicaturopsis crispa FD-325 SS-3]|nr:hypothetical protein PLICRDRAFT_56048 [Plicaturopsis crispa FD-325 SS-3]
MSMDAHIPGAWPRTPAAKARSTAPPKATATPRPRVTARSRRIIESSDSESDREIIELSSDSEGSSPRKPAPRPTYKGPSASAPAPVDQTEDPWDADDGSILTLDEPRSARKPIRDATVSTPSLPIASTSIIPQTPRKRVQRGDALATTTASAATGLGGLPSASASKPPRVMKKTAAAAEQVRREIYAQTLFAELNRTVFNNGLPANTALKWNVRLLTTAGRAKWHRNREGVHTTEIELAVKILDCDERIRNTLAHEMIHLACWIINGEPKEGHGRIFKDWGAKMMRKRPDIEVSTKHNYEISYPYEWECGQCAKIYGRFSKSIRPDECVCGACKVGRLVPLFGGPKAPKTKANSRLATGTPQGSPRSLSKTGGIGTRGALHTIDDSDEDDVEVLATTFGGVRIGGL